ncbi:MAG: DNA polymerase III subunit gamma/tau [Bacteroidia bacterium]|nr:DNA polymerase III subunit gamma/tau [Bacteroidia bacterium]MCF8426047.1 DNA polymerase III subunit gamma/tau [Bacteroidia bacterium]MCF8445358.1 DNA polymerase III subunit gamma/tau [Bacteroidia bacterium]
MENFVVSARKYRPDRFDTVVGQEHVVQTLKNAIKNRHLAHAFLFCGPRGVGKTTSARLLAKTINCTNLSADFEACNTCDSCRAFNSNASFNIYELDAASNNSVDDIRGLVDQVRYAPQGAQYKIYIIDEVHMLSASAFNAFLKTLEEPPPYAKFILATTEKHKILPTILSRCQVFDFHRIKIDDAVKQLKKICESENIQVEEEALHVIGKKADGAMRDALSIFDRIVSFSGNKITYADVISNLNILDYDYYFRATNLLLSGNIAGSLLLFDEILNNGFEAQHFLQGFSEHIRNLMVCKHPDTLKLLEVAPNVASKFGQQSGTCSSSWLLNALNLLNQTDFNYKLSKNQRLHVELALMKLCNLQRVIQISTQQPMVDEKKKINLSTGTSTNSENTISKETISVQPKVTALVADLPSNESIGSPKSAIEKMKEQIALQKQQEQTAKLENNEEPEEKIENKDFTQETFLTIWNSYINNLENGGKSRISVFLKESPVKFLDPLKVEIELKSQLEHETMDEEWMEMLPFLRKQLQNTLLEVVFSVNKERVQTGTRVSKTDQLKQMVDKNPLLGDFVQGLGLEIDY